MPLVLLLGLLLSPILAANRVPAKESLLQVRLGADSNICGITKPSRLPKNKLGLIVWLHGGMRSPLHNKGAEAHRALLSFVNPEQYYLCSPSAFSGQDWLSEQGILHIEALINYMVSHYPIDPKNINMVGVSDGSLGVIAYSLSGSHSLNRRVLISSFPQLVIAPEHLAQHLEFKTGTWDFFQGGQDRLFPSSQVEPYLQVWKATLPNVRVHFFPHGEHDFSFYAANASDLLKSLWISPQKPSP